jgi:tetratricopeptide (TPR) repeat protein
MRFLLSPAVVLFLFVSCLSAQNVLVLPFANKTSSPNLDWIGESIAERIRESLEAEGVLVLSREDRLEACRRLGMTPQGELTLASIIKIGITLDAARVVYGAYDVAESASGGESIRTLHLTGHILDGMRMNKEAAIPISGPLEHLAGLQRQMAWNALRRVAPKLAGSEAAFAAKWPSTRLDALEAYARGLLAANEEQQHRFFAQAARLDETFHQPLLRLGRMHFLREDYRVAAGWLQKIPASDPNYMEAEFLLGLCLYHTGNYRGAQQAFEIVSEAVPLNEVWNNLAIVLSRLDDPEAAAIMDRALRGDPSDPEYRFNMGCLLWKQEDFSSAAEHFRVALQQNPDDQEAASLLERASKSIPRRNRDPNSDNLERLKYTFEERAYRQLKAVMEAGKR